ncbi:hypothetical protein [Candidatus Thiosymbion oneisti]|uniref:hypothetical protein n=2 Tax=Candidatus Thiosymbion oneisti TaxID=589554 RepID=UPI00105C2A27|nr:hypothetical protein [Candidatus Thiosymbion oneisti]
MKVFVAGRRERKLAVESVARGQPSRQDVTNKAKPVARPPSCRHKKQLESQLKQIERDLEADTPCLDANDAPENPAGDRLGEAPALADKLAALKERQARQQAQLKQLADRSETQLSRTDPDARALSKGNQHVTGDNVQNRVDSKHQHEVTNAGNDQNQLSGQWLGAMAALSVNKLTVVADSGYYSETQLAACQAANATVYVPIPDKHKAVNAQERLRGEHFHYHRTLDGYTGPTGEILRPRGSAHKQNGIWRICFYCLFLFFQPVARWLTFSGQTRPIKRLGLVFRAAEAEACTPWLRVRILSQSPEPGEPAENQCQ